MNNEKILNIMENLAKAVYDIGATVKHIYKDEHPAIPPIPTPQPPSPPSPPRYTIEKEIPFPPAPNVQDRCPPPVVVRQPERYGGLGFKPIMKPKEPWFDKQRPVPAVRTSRGT